MPTKPRKARSRKKARKGPLIRLSSAARLQIGGGVLATLAMVTLLSLLSTTRGTLTAAWLEMLQRAFGWGRLV